MLHVTVHGRRREMGLGGVPDVSLKEAREAAEKWRGLARVGIDPIKERDRQRREDARHMHLLKDIAFDAFEGSVPGGGVDPTVARAERSLA